MKRLIVLIALVIPGLAVAQTSVGATKFVSATPTVDTNAYATGELIGGKLTFAGAVRGNVGTGYVIGVTIKDLSAQASDLDLVLFSSDPTATTFTDQAAFDIADADVSKVLGVINFGSSARFAFADNGVKHVGSIVIPIRAASSSTIYGALVSRGTPTFAAATDVTVTLAVAQD